MPGRKIQIPQQWFSKQISKFLERNLVYLCKCLFDSKDDEKLCVHNFSWKGERANWILSFYLQCWRRKVLIFHLLWKFCGYYAHPYKAPWVRFSEFKIFSFVFLPIFGLLIVWCWCLGSGRPSPPAFQTSLVGSISFCPARNLVIWLTCQLCGEKDINQREMREHMEQLQAAWIWKSFIRGSIAIWTKGD